MTRLPRCALLLALTLAPARLAAQQDNLGEVVGQRIRARVLVPSRGSNFRIRTVTGSVARLGADTLFLSGADRQGELAVPRARLRSIELSAGRRTRTGHGAFLGAVIGLGTGAVSGVVICLVTSGCDATGSDSLLDGNLTGAVALVLGLGGGLAGTGIGAIVGSLSHTDRWRPIRLGGIGGPRPGMDGIRLGLTVGF